VNSVAAGNRALDSERFETAVKRYERALTRAAEEGNKQYQAIAMYGLARANAHLCRVSLAERWFLDSIALREMIQDDPQIAFLTQNLIEFARFLVANGRLEDAVPYFSRSVPMLENLGIEQSDPIGYAEFLDDYVSTLRILGRAEDTEPHAQRASNIRQRFPDLRAIFRPTPYPSSCARR
jgi:tetratricopeptide (TPR) repeat protein